MDTYMIVALVYPASESLVVEAGALRPPSLREKVRGDSYVCREHRCAGSLDVNNVWIPIAKAIEGEGCHRMAPHLIENNLKLAGVPLPEPTVI